jgi:hypothetical protein
MTNGTEYHMEPGLAITRVDNKAETVAGTATEVSSQQNLSPGHWLRPWAISARKTGCHPYQR